MTIEQAKFIRMLVIDFDCSYRQVHKMFQKVYIKEKDWYKSPILETMLPKLRETMDDDLYAKYLEANTPSGNMLTGRDLVLDAEDILDDKFNIDAY